MDRKKMELVGYIVFGIILIVFSIGFTDPKGAKSHLEKMSFKEIKVQGRNFFQCGKSSLWKTGFKARNAEGKIVEGTICEGLWTGTKLVLK